MSCLKCLLDWIIFRITESQNTWDFLRWSNKNNFDLSLLRLLPQSSYYCTGTGFACACLVCFGCGHDIEIPLRHCWCDSVFSLVLKVLRHSLSAFLHMSSDSFFSFQMMGLVFMTHWPGNLVNNCLYHSGQTKHSGLWLRLMNPRSPELPCSCSRDPGVPSSRATASFAAHCYCVCFRFQSKSQMCVFLPLKE